MRIWIGVTLGMLVVCVVGFLVASVTILPAGEK